MALDIVAQDSIIDETTGLQDDDVDQSVAPHSTNATLQYLLSLDGPGGLTSPEVAFQADFAVASASAGETITSVVLAQNSSGTAFSTTVGVNSGIQTVDGNYVWLFQDAAHANVVIGVIGTSNPATPPAATGPLAFSFALINTSTTNADLYTVQYVPLSHPDATNSDDRIDLTNKVFASVAGTTVFNFSQLGDAPSGHNNWYILDADAASSQKILVTAHNNGVQAEVNVSTQGLGVASQDVRFGRELQVDLISGGTQSAGKNFTNTPIAPDYDTHIENVSNAGFSISQSTPTNTTADIEIHAYNNDDNAEGAAFPGDDNDAEINITGATFKLNGVATTAAALGITVDLSGTGLVLRNVGEGVTVDFTTAGGDGGTFDRFTIKNIDTEKDYFDVKEVHFAGGTTSAYTEEVGSFINFDDDGPHISTSGTEPTLTVDETVLATNDTKSVAVNFSSSYGADGAGTLTYALSVVAGPSGLVDTATGQAVNLSLNGAVVEGRTATSNDLVFTVSVDASGNVTLDQVRAVVHADTSDSNDAATLASDALVKLTATITDKDGDHQAATLNIGQNLSFLDDGPHISTSGTEPTLTVDETVLATNDTKSVAVNFSSSYGADGAGTLTYALSVVAGPSGLVDTATGQAVNLSLNGAVVEGRTATSNDLVFTVSVDASGNVTLDQVRAVVHADTSDSNDAATLASDALVKLTATITDKDGDHQAATLNIGQNLSFLDDGPHISTSGTEPTLTVDETVLATNDTKSVAVNFSSSYGADGAGTLTYALSVVAGPSGLVDTATGQAVNLSLNGAVVEGRTATSNDLVFTVSVDASGNVTLDQVRAVVHADTSDSNDAATLASDALVKLTATITDKDGDHQAATLNIGQNLSFLDDGPTTLVNDINATYGNLANSTWNNNPGADGFKSLSITLDSYKINGADGTETPIFTGPVIDGSGNYVFTGSITDDFTNDGVANTQTLLFTLTFDPDDGTPPDSTYTFQANAPSSIVVLPSSSGKLGPGGPDPVQTLTIGSGLDSKNIVFTAVKATAAGSVTSIIGNLNKTEAQIQITPLPSYIDPQSMNVSSSGIGVGNNNLDGNSVTGVDAAITSGGKYDESFVVDPTGFLVSGMKFYIDNSVGGYDPATEDLLYRTYIRNADNSVSVGTTTKVLAGDLTSIAGGQKTFTIGSATGASNIDAVQLFMGRGTVKIPVIDFITTQQILAQPLEMNFTATLSDNDSDTKSDAFQVTAAVA